MRGLIFVSISLSSGFSFQVSYPPLPPRLRSSVSISLSSGFSFQVSYPPLPPRLRSSVSISLSSGFSFQERVGKLESETGSRFNLVIERLLISGCSEFHSFGPFCLVSISLSSGFSFQGRGCCKGPGNHRLCFNHVIERLLISGERAIAVAKAPRIVSISLSSGFSFQAPEKTDGNPPSPVSISLSSGFSFQDCARTVDKRISFSFQSRYRAASHFRRNLLASYNGTFHVCFSFQSRYQAASHFRAFVAKPRCAPQIRSFNLVIERLLISGESLVPPLAR